MTKRALRLVILILVLALAAAVYAAITVRAKAPENEQEAEAEAIPILDFDTEDITAIRWNYSGEKYGLSRDAAGSWVWNADPACPISTDQVKNLIGTLASVCAERTVSAGTDKAEYGLDAPRFEYAVTDSTGNETVLRLGDYSSYAKGYYADVNGGSEVYVVSYAVTENFARSPLDMLMTDSVPDLSAATSLAVTAGGRTKTCRYYADSSGMSYSTQHHWFTGNNGRWQALSETEINSLLYELSNLTWQSCVSYKAGEEELAACGLKGGGCVRVTAEYSGEDGTRRSFTLLLGDYEGSDCYAAIEGGSMIYTISGAVADRFIFLDLDELAADDICLLDFDGIGSFTVRADGLEAGLVYAGEESGIDAAGELISVPVWQCGAKKLDAALVESFGKALTSLEAQSDAKYAVSRGELAEVFIDVGKEEPMELSFHTYSSSQMLVIRDGSAYFVDAQEGQTVVELALSLLNAATE